MAERDPIAEFEKSVASFVEWEGGISFMFPLEDSRAVLAELNRLRTQLAEEKAIYREVEERLAAAMSKLAESERLRESAEARVVVLEAAIGGVPKTLVDELYARNMPLSAGRLEQLFAALSASGVEVLARGKFFEDCTAMGVIVYAEPRESDGTPRDGVPCLVIAAQPQENTDEPA